MPRVPHAPPIILGGTSYTSSQTFEYYRRQRQRRANFAPGARVCDPQPLRQPRIRAKYYCVSAHFFIPLTLIPLAMLVRFDLTFSNPKGIPSSSPRLPPGGYLGIRHNHSEKRPLLRAKGPQYISLGRSEADERMCQAEVRPQESYNNISQGL